MLWPIERSVFVHGGGALDNLLVPPMSGPFLAAIPATRDELLLHLAAPGDARVQRVRAFGVAACLGWWDELPDWAREELIGGLLDLTEAAANICSKI